MIYLFNSIYSYFSKNRLLFVFFLIVIIAFIVIFASRIKLEENVNAIIPDDKNLNKISRVIESSEISDQIIINISLSDTSLVLPDSLIRFADNLSAKLDTNILIEELTYKIDESLYSQVYDIFFNYLPFFLDSSDYEDIANRLTNDEIENNIKNDLKVLISPSGIVTKKYIYKDPLNIVPLVLRKLEKFRFGDSFIIYDSRIFSKNKKHLLLFINPEYSSANTSKNTVLIEDIENAINNNSEEFIGIDAEYYGGTAVAAANAKCIKRDIIITVSIAVIILILVFIIIFRRIRIFFLLFLPVIIGAGVSIAILSITEDKISAISLGIGAVLVGITIDYSLHLYTHFRNSGSVSRSLKNVSQPILMSSITTASAFLCLLLIKSDALNDLGKFAALSVVVSALFVLLFIPVFLKRKDSSISGRKRKTIFDRFVAFKFHRSKIIIILIVVLSVVFAFTLKNIRFNSDISTLNYMPDKLKEAEENLKKISSQTYGAMYILSLGDDLNSALENSEKHNAILDDKKYKDFYYDVTSASDLLLSKNMQIKKIKQWSDFWKDQGKERVINTIKEKGKKYHFKEKAFRQFYHILNKEFKPVDDSVFNPMKKMFLKNYITEFDSGMSVVSILKVDRSNKDKLFDELEDQDNLIFFDQLYLTNRLFKILKDDFNMLVTISLIVVFVIMLVFLGRIELTIIAFTPLIISWLWTLGLMGIFNLEFNIFNIIVSSFIFGLGIDYCIFIMRGLQNDYKEGKTELPSYKLSILISAITSITGFGILILANHPALRSIALVSLVGISAILFISYAILPFLFSALVSGNQRTGQGPVTIGSLFFSLTTIIIFLIGSFLLTLLVPLLKILPLPNKTAKHLHHIALCYVMRFLVYFNINTKKIFINRGKLDFSKPSVIISNHQSQLDLSLTIMLNPKIVVLTNEWVWNSPYFGHIIKYSDYVPLYRGLEKGYTRLKKVIQNGYSVLIFPEGSRTPDGRIKRFHQGAFKLADMYNLEIQPIMIHGAFHCLNKHEFFLRKGKITVKIFDREKLRKRSEDEVTYRNHAIEYNKFYREEYDKLRKSIETPDYFKRRLINQFIYKGVELEWYLRIKLRFEKNYNLFNDVIPRDCKIVDIGCGYGFLDFMLNYISDKRIIHGIDYDEEKINTAKSIAKHFKSIKFSETDITQIEIPESEVYILNDVLHYIPEQKQLSILRECMNKIPANGMIIVRDADKDMQKRIKGTKAIEFLSTKVIKFNKTKYKNLSFISGVRIISLAQENGLSVERIDNTKYTSDIIYIIK